MRARMAVGVTLAAAMMVAAGARSGAAATDESFQVRSTQDLVDLCGVQRGDPLASQSIHFCEGYLVGIYHYHQALTSGRGQAPVFCPAANVPTRDEAVAMFVAWGRSHPQHMAERPVDGVFRWAVETWPCRRANRRPAR